MRHICASIVATCMLAGTSFAATINVPADYSTIQEAIDAASNGDEILVAPGTYTGTGDWVINLLDKPITIRATGTPEETIIDGQGARRVVECSSGEGAGTIIEGFTITGGSASYGGGIYCYYYSSPTINGCTITGNSANYGGGIYCYRSDSTITGCMISDNTASSGGGIYSDVFKNSGPRLSETSLCGNAPNPIQGAWVDLGQNCIANYACIDSDGDGVLDECDDSVGDGVHEVPAEFESIQTAIAIAQDGDVILVSPGTYTGIGGSIIDTGGKALTIRALGSPEETVLHGQGARRVVYCNSGETSKTVIEGFTLTGGRSSDGAGVYCNGSSPMLVRCIITGNTSSGAYMGTGGGISCYNSYLTLTECIISNNTGSNEQHNGGGIYCSGGSPMFIDCSVMANSIGSGEFSYGGGIYIHSSSPTFAACRVSNNSSGNEWSWPGSGGGIMCAGSVPLLGDSTVCCNWPDQIAGNWSDGGGNIVSDICPTDCQCNEIDDQDEIADGTSFDCDQDGVPDECEIDCDGDGLIDDCDSEPDQDGNGVPDNCDPDCNDNGIADGVEVLFGWADDCDGDAVPDDCQLADGSATDCDLDGTLDHCQITGDPALDCDEDGAIDSCAIADGSVEDCNENGIPDSCDIANGGDADGDGYLDECECAADIAGPDGPGFPDGIVGTDDLLTVIGYWGSSIPDGDVNGDGIVGTDDLLAVIGAWGPCE